LEEYKKRAERLFSYTQKCSEMFRNVLKRPEKDKNGGCLSYFTVLEYPSVKNKCPYYRYELQKG
jgi:hypothetical protein